MAQCQLLLKEAEYIWQIFVTVSQNATKDKCHSTQHVGQSSIHLPSKVHIEINWKYFSTRIHHNEDTTFQALVFVLLVVWQILTRLHHLHSGKIRECQHRQITASYKLFFPKMLKVALWYPSLDHDVLRPLQ